MAQTASNPHQTGDLRDRNERLSKLTASNGDLIRGVGDFDGDGYDDILVRVSRGYDTETFDTCGQDPDPFGPWDVLGRLYEVYRGGPDGLETTPTVSHQRYESTPGGLTLGPLSPRFQRRWQTGSVAPPARRRTTRVRSSLAVN